MAGAARADTLVAVPRLFRAERRAPLLGLALSGLGAATTLLVTNPPPATTYQRISGQWEC